MKGSKSFVFRPRALWFWNPIAIKSLVSNIFLRTGCPLVGSLINAMKSFLPLVPRYSCSFFSRTSMLESCSSSFLMQSPWDAGFTAKQLENVRRCRLAKSEKPRLGKALNVLLSMIFEVSASTALIQSPRKRYLVTGLQLVFNRNIDVNLCKLNPVPRYNLQGAESCAASAILLKGWKDCPCSSIHLKSPKLELQSNMFDQVCGPAPHFNQDPRSSKKVSTLEYII